MLNVREKLHSRLSTIGFGRGKFSSGGELENDVLINIKSIVNDYGIHSIIYHQIWLGMLNYRYGKY